MKKIQTYRGITAGMILFSLFCAAAFWISAISSEKEATDQLKYLNQGWHYVDQTGAEVAITLPCKIEAGETLELIQKDSALLTTGDVVATYGAVYDVEIYMGDSLLYQFRDGGREINDAVRGNIVCSGEIPGEEAHGELHLIYHSSTGNYKLSEVTVSSANALMKSVFYSSLFCLLVSIAMLVIGVLAILFGVVMKIQKEQNNRIFCIGAFLMVCGLWCLSDSAFVHMMADYSNLIFDFDFYFFMVMPIPLAYFIMETGEMKKYKVIQVVPLLYFLNIILQSLLAFAGVFTFFRMLYVTHVLMMAAGVLGSLWALYTEYKRKKDIEIFLGMLVLASVGILGSVAILLYICIGYSTYQVVYQTGLLTLMTILLSVLLKEFMQSVRNRAEAIIYKQLSEQDKLTNLDNRRAFDALLEKMEQGLVNYENAALLFMDVNFLKKANDTYGHEFGDKLIIGAAVCIKNAFGAAGYCYRIGGDEFCAVLLDSSHSSEELQERIKKEILNFNQNNELSIELSMAVGCCFLVENGHENTISQWKTEADSRMYADKKESRQKEPNEITGRSL